jgi:hypothetical protein
MFIDPLLKNGFFHCCARSLPRECFYRAVAQQLTIPAFRRHVTVLWNWNGCTVSRKYVHKKCFLKARRESIYF